MAFKESLTLFTTFFSVIYALLKRVMESSRRPISLFICFDNDFISLMCFFSELADSYLALFSNLTLSFSLYATSDLKSLISFSCCISS